MQGEDVFERTYLIAIVICSHFIVQEEDILGNYNGKCHLCILCSTCKPLCKILGMHFVTLLNIIMPSYYSTHLSTKCHELTLTVKLLIINVT